MSKPILQIWDEAAQKYVGVPAVKGNKGEKGEPGIAPHIGDNGNWFIGDVDTGKPSRGADGAMQPTGEYDTSGLTLNNTGTGAYDIALACQGVWNGKFRQSAITNGGIFVTTYKGETSETGLLEQLVLNPNTINVCDFTVSPNKYMYITANGMEVRKKAYPIVLNGKHIDTSGTQVKNLAAPTDDTDAATKKYVDDAVAQAGGSGGGGAYKVNVTIDEDTGYYVADKTYAEILAAYNAGSMPYMVLGSGTVSDICALQHVDNGAMLFGYTYIDNNQLVVCKFEITSDSNVNDYTTFLDVSSLIS